MTVNKSETTAQSLRINRLNQTQFSQAGDLPVNELYLVDPEFTGGKILTTDLTGDIVESTSSVDDLKTRVIFRTWVG